MKIRNLLLSFLFMAFSAHSFADNVLTASDVSLQVGQTASLEISLNNLMTTFNAFVFDLQLPKGVYVANEAGDYIANFATYNYQVTVFATPAEGGNVAGTGAYAYGQTCVLNAMPNENYYFIHWKKNDNEIVSTNPNYLFEVYENAAYVAYFALNAYEITATANPTNGGTIEGAGNYEAGMPCTLTATAAEGFTFVNWTDATGAVVSANPAYTFTVSGDASYVANFSLNSYAITATANPTEGGTVTGAGTYNHGASATLTATANAGYNFINWTKGNDVVSTEPSYTFTVTESGAYIANFEEIIIPTYEVTVTANPAEGGTVTGNGVYEEGETVTVTAAPSEGFAFQNWTENGEIVSEEAEYTFVVTADRNLVAHFDFDGVIENSDITYTVYPNPTIDKLIVESKGEITSIEIYNISGNLVYRRTDNSETVEIDVNNFSAGTYIIRLTSKDFVQT